MLGCLFVVVVKSAVEDGDVGSCGGGDVVLVNSLPFYYDEYVDNYSTCDLPTSLWTCPIYIGKNLTTQGAPLFFSIM